MEDGIRDALVPRPEGEQWTVSHIAPRELDGYDFNFRVNGRDLPTLRLLGQALAFNVRDEMKKAVELYLRNNL
jgi:hypothetical protein